MVIEHCLSKVEHVNGDREPPFSFFKFSFSYMRVCVCAYLFILFISPFFLFLTGYLSFVEKMRIQNAENLEKENLETKHEIRTKREVNKNKIKL